MAIRVIWPNRPTHVETGVRKFKRADVEQVIVDKLVDGLVEVDLVNQATRLRMDPMTARCLANTILSVIGDDGKLPDGKEPIAR